MSVCLCVSMCVREHTCTRVVHGGVHIYLYVKKRTYVVFPLSPHNFWERGSLPEPDDHQLTSMAGCSVTFRSSSSLQFHWHDDHMCIPPFLTTYVHAGDPNSSPHICVLILFCYFWLLYTLWVTLQMLLLIFTGKTFMHKSLWMDFIENGLMRRGLGIGESG